MKKSKKLIKIMMNQDEKNNSWVVFPRYIQEMYFEGKLNRWEYFVYLHLRLKCDPYGNCWITLSGVRDELEFRAGAVGRNEINRIMLKLKSSQLIWFEGRQGKSGSFKVRFGDFLLPNKKGRTSLEKYFHPESDIETQVESSEVKPEVVNTQKELKTMKESLMTRFSMPSGSSSSPAHNNDNHNHNEKYKVDHRGSFSNPTQESRSKLIKPESYIPTNSEEEFILKIALELREKDMTFLLSRYNTYGIEFMRDCWEKLQNSSKAGIRDPRAFFNDLITRAIEERNQL